MLVDFVLLIFLGDEFYHSGTREFFSGVSCLNLSDLQKKLYGDALRKKNLFEQVSVYFSFLTV